MQPRVHCRGARRGARESGLERQRLGAAALEARPMPRRQRRRFIAEEQFCVAAPKNLAPAPFEFADAGDPLLRRPAPPADALRVVVKAPAAIAHQPAALGNCTERAVGIDAVRLQRERSRSKIVIGCPTAATGAGGGAAGALASA